MARKPDTAVLSLCVIAVGACDGCSFTASCSVRAACVVGVPGDGHAGHDGRPVKDYTTSSQSTFSAHMCHLLFLLGHGDVINVFCSVFQSHLMQ